MAAKLTCPECEKSLTLAKAPAPGKKVRCPRCQAVFEVPETDGELEEAEAPAPKQKAAIQKNAPARPAAKSAPKPEPTPPPEPKKSPLSEEEDSAGTYGFATSAEEDAEHDKGKPKIDYAPDLTVKDPRGNAVATLARPSSLVIINGGVLGLVGLFLFSAGIWPFFFSDTVAGTRRSIEVNDGLERMVKDEDAKGAKGGGGKQFKKLKENILKAGDTEELAPLVDPLIKNVKPSEEYIREMKPADLEKEKPVGYKVWELLEERAIFNHIMMIVVGVAIFLFGGVMTYAAVQMQTLESYNWGMTSTVMAIVGGVGSMIYSMISAIDTLSAEESGAFDYVMLIVMILFSFFGIGAGAWALTTAMNPEIKEAFFFDPEADKKEEEASDEEEGDEEEEEDEEEDE